MHIDLKKLLYQSTHRGCKELDLIFGRFAGDKLETLTAEELRQYARLLAMEDAAIYGMFAGHEVVPLLVRGIVNKIKSHLSLSERV